MGQDIMARLLEILIIGSVYVPTHGTQVQGNSTLGNSTATPVIQRFKFMAVYYKQKPYIYNNNATSELSGMIPDIFNKMKKKCPYPFQVELKWDAGSSDNFTALLWGNNTNSELGGQNVIWLPLLRDLDHDEKHQLKDVNLTDTPLFSSLGMEVLMQRRKIGIVSKISHGLEGCKHLFLLALMMAVLFGVTIWFIVSIWE